MSKFHNVLFAALLAGPALAQDTPYAGLESRSIASLSESDIAQLEAGQGWGLALSAELNGYPGPTHVLELADQLELSDAQHVAIMEIYDRMNARARVLGAEFIAAEVALDSAFSEGEIDVHSLTILTSDAARIEGELRAVHLAAHLEVTPLLSRHQRVIYNQSRGYADGAAHGQDHDH